MSLSMRCFSFSVDMMRVIKSLICAFLMMMVSFWAIFANGKTCSGIKLNTDVPFVGNCIETTKGGDKTNQINAFPKLMWAMMKLLMTVILVMSLLMIVAAGVMMTTAWLESRNYTKGMDIIEKVAVGMALLGASGVIPKLINPNFFG